MAVNRTDRRKERTRAALIIAAQELLVENRTAVSIREITDRADVGFGSFYNHFESKDQLFEQAVLAALDAFEDWRSRVVEDLDDPAEIFAVSFRLIGRLPRRIPTFAMLLLRIGPQIFSIDRGLRASALADLTRGVQLGKFSGDPEQLLMAAGGALMGLTQLLMSRPEMDDAEVADAMAAMILRMLGVPEVEAQRLCQLPLPEVAGSETLIDGAEQS